LSIDYTISAKPLIEWEMMGVDNSLAFCWNFIVAIPEENIRDHPGQSESQRDLGGDRDRYVYLILGT
jgi:hypothetical protein